MSALGRHILVEFFQCDPDIMNDVTVIEQSMVNASVDAGATVINSTFHHFSPYGVSGVVVIQESHLAIHTWPEFRYAAVDIFTCGDTVNPWHAYDKLKAAFKASHGSSMEIKRGQIDLLERVSIEVADLRDDAERQIIPKFKRDVWFTDKDENIALSLRHNGNVLFREKSPYQHVQILDTFAFGKMLTIDNMVMCTERDEFIYHEMLVHVAAQVQKQLKKVLVIGGGDGGTVREVLRYPSVESVTMVEIDEAVVRASREHLSSISLELDNPKLNLIIGDGIKYLREADDESFDLIIVDGSDPVGPAEGLFGRSFYTDVYRCLKPGGAVSLQSEGPLFSSKAFVELHQMLKSIFGESQVNCFLAHISTYPTGMWSFNHATKDGAHPIHDFDQDQATAFADQHKLKYYNAGIHQAAFALPTFVQTMLNGKS